jgi:zinc protease
VPKPSFETARLTLIEAELPTNYIEASFIAPSWGDEHFAASILTMRMLSRRLFDEVRTKRNLSYAPSARHAWSSDVSRGSLYVTAVDANTTIKVMHDEVRKLQTILVSDKELTGAKSVFITEQLMSNEATNGQASWLALCDIVGGDYKLANDLNERVKAVTAEDVRAFVKAHIGRLQTVVMGDPAKIDKALFSAL